MTIPAQEFSSHSRGLSQQEHPQWCSCYPFIPDSGIILSKKTQAPMVPLPPSQLPLHPPPMQKCPGKRNLGAKPREVNLSIGKESQQKLAELFIPQNLQHLPCAAENEAQSGSGLDQYPQHLWLSIPEEEVLSPAGDTADPGGRTGAGQRRLQGTDVGQREGQTPSCSPPPRLSFRSVISHMPQLSLLLCLSSIPSASSFS